MIDRLKMAGELAANQDFVRQAAITKALRILQDAEVVDPGGITEVNYPTFSDSAREALIARGYRIYPLQGQSIKSLRELGKKFVSIWHEEDPDFEAYRSRRSEVAINPGRLFLEGSNNKTLEEQTRMVAEFSGEFKGMTDVEIIVGEAPTYVELAFAHFDAVGEYLFGRNYDYHFTRTKTPIMSMGDFINARVGHFSDQFGLNVAVSGQYIPRNETWIAPLVVPAEIKQ